MARPKGPPTKHLSVNLPPEQVEWLAAGARCVANAQGLTVYVQDLVRIGIQHWQQDTDLDDPADQADIREAIEAYRKGGERQ